MFPIFYISLKMVLNLQESFMIFQRRQRYLKNFALIKQNSIKNKGGLLLAWCHFFFPFSCFDHIYLFTIFLLPYDPILFFSIN
ncbi:hypothetical protein GIB67_017931 [Kingdonia uniflora]|uniref:Uncharacterized protein n=1 Tax=Kingdonia uniflora TaxID=39325 RepID=A0A7J7NDY9_9MAGN|nr:hypothetical protein GIB67_017931 [Kingdonia uniflora]